MDDVESTIDTRGERMCVFRRERKLWESFLGEIAREMRRGEAFVALPGKDRYMMTWASYIGLCLVMWTSWWLFLTPNIYDRMVEERRMYVCIVHLLSQWWVFWTCELVKPFSITYLSLCRMMPHDSCRELFAVFRLLTVITITLSRDFVAVQFICWDISLERALSLSLSSNFRQTYDTYRYIHHGLAPQAA